jgi:hypothetical protein
MKGLLQARPFENQMSRTQTILGWIYLPVHILVIPLLANMYVMYYPSAVSEVQANIVYYAIGWVFLAAVMLKWLRGQFDLLLDNPGRCFLNMLAAFGLDYVLSFLMALVLLLVESSVSNPNNEAIEDLATVNYGAMRSIAIFLAPLVEEVLFRGVVFGSIRRKNRLLAYIVSIAIFCLYHVWQYAVASLDPWLLLYALQYIPVSLALTWLYDRSGCIWPSVFFHMMINALSCYVMSMF